MADHAIHSPLEFVDSIRILELTARGPPYTLEGSLTSARLSDNPSYRALSYVWGQPSPKDPDLLVNEKLHRITASLLDALRALVLKHGTIRLWIDQVSINQQDDSEKTAQVLLMPRIFRQASTVIGWLGVETPGSDIAMKFLDVLSAWKVDHRPRDDAALNYLMSRGLLEDPMDVLHPNSPMSQAVTELVQRAWFQRLWIVQEATLAKDLVLHCGRTSLSADVFFTGVDALSSTVSDPPVTWARRPYWHAHRLGQLRLKLAKNEPQSLMRLANVFSSWQCRREQDRLNALIGIEAQNRTMRFMFHPSYCVSGPKLYQAFATRYLNTNHTPDILHFAGRGYCSEAFVVPCGGVPVLALKRSPDDLPSWTPDWRISSRPIALTTMEGADITSEFAATSSSSLSNVQGSRLHVRGIKVDTINVCGCPYWDSIMDDAYKVFTDWFELAEDTSICENLESNFASTLLMDGRVKPVDRGDLFVTAKEIDHLFAHWRSRNISLAPSSLDESTSGLEESTRFGNLAEELCRYRRFFVTQQGRLGLGPACSGPGMSVYLIHGLTTPFLVHDRESQNVLFGECFVSGLMYGGIVLSDQDQTLCFI